MATNTKKMSIIPLGNRVLIEPIDEMETQTASGIIIPDTVSKEKPAQGKVIAVGEGKIDDGKKIPVSVQKGDVILFSQYGYDEVKVDGKEYYILEEDKILAVIK
tara:strand:+ start:288 stop:599 length:312 start_codon:yes stop_codon:yes gene_type:complete